MLRIAVLLWFCLVPATVSAEAPKLFWRGCGISKLAFMEGCAVAYEKETGVAIQLSGGGAALGIEAAATGGSDLGGTCRHCIDSNRESWPKLKLAVVAWDALVTVVNPSNPIDSISQKEIQGILRQQITNWNQLGGPDMPIVAVARRGKVSGVGYCTRLLILGDADASFGRTVIRLNSSGPVEKLVERQPKAIAISGISSAKKRNLKILSVDGVAPTPQNIAEGKYPYFRPLYVAFRPGENPEADRFVAWLLSEQGQAEIERQGTVSLRQGSSLVSKFAHLPATTQISNYETIKTFRNVSNAE